MDMRSREYESGEVTIPFSAVISHSTERKRYSLLEDAPEFNLNEVKISKEHADAIQEYYRSEFFSHLVDITKMRVGYDKLTDEQLNALTPFKKLQIDNSGVVFTGIKGDVGIIQRAKTQEFYCDLILRKRVSYPPPKKL